MALFSQLLLLPLAPARGTAWFAQKVAGEAERQYYDPAPLMEQLASLHRDLEDGRISMADFEREEEDLLRRIQRTQTAVSRELPEPPPEGTHD